MKLVSVSVRHAVTYAYKCSVYWIDMKQHFSTGHRVLHVKCLFLDLTVYNSNTVLQFCTDFVIGTCSRNLSTKIIRSGTVRELATVVSDQPQLCINFNFDAYSGLHNQSPLLCFKQNTLHFLW